MHYYAGKPVPASEIAAAERAARDMAEIKQMPDAELDKLAYEILAARRGLAQLDARKQSPVSTDALLAETP